MSASKSFLRCLLDGAPLPLEEHMAGVQRAAYRLAAERVAGEAVLAAAREQQRRRDEGTASLARIITHDPAKFCRMARQVRPAIKHRRR